MERINHVDFFTQLLMCLFKLILILSGKEHALQLLIYLRALLSIKQLCSDLFASPFLKALLISVSMSLFHWRTSHRDNFFSINFMDPAIGQNVTNIYVYSTLVFISTFSCQFIATLLIPYVCNDNPKGVKQRMGYQKSN
jgi:hypothetical protein